nr:adenosylcobinamide-GDP ribazoletransferase [Isachenkonia alkalipeptolytica]
MLTFLTRIPVKFSFKIRQREFHRGIFYMPLIGGIIGIVLGVVGYLMHFMDPLIRAVILWMVYLWLTGGLHLDGLSDLSDGIFSNRKEEDLRRVIKDSHIGAFGVIAIVVNILLTVALFSFMGPAYIILGPLLSRSGVLFAMGFSSYPKNQQGLGKGVIEATGLRTLLMSTLLPVVIVLIFYPTVIFLPLFLTFMGGLFLSKWITMKLGGLTGDGIGFIIEVLQPLSLFLIYLINLS